MAVQQMDPGWMGGLISCRLFVARQTGGPCGGYLNLFIIWVAGNDFSGLVNYPAWDPP